MTAYSVLATVDMFSGIPGVDGTPYGNPANAILSDGSYCIAVWIEESGNQLLRVYRLGKDLTVLGYADIDTGRTDAWPTPYLVALPGNKVFMVSRMGSPYTPLTDTWASWIVDCSGNIPAVGPIQPMTTSLIPGYDSGGIFDVYDQATDRIILASTEGSGIWDPPMIIQSFRASTGVLLAEALAGSASNPIGLYMNPNDSTKFKVPTKWSAAVLDFTVALESSVTYDGVTGAISPNWPLAGGSPYLTGGGGFIRSSGWDYITSPGSSGTVEYWDYSGAVLASVTRPLDYHPDEDGDAACLMSGRHLVCVYEEATGSGYREQPKHGLFVGVDQLADPPTIEMLELPYYGLPTPLPTDPPGWWDYYTTTIAEWPQAAIVTADQGSGIILVTMTTYTCPPSGVEYYSLFVWVIQGPTDKPNLSGGPLGVDVYFDPR